MTLPQTQDILFVSPTTPQIQTTMALTTTRQTTLASTTTTNSIMSSQVLDSLSISSTIGRIRPSTVNMARKQTTLTRITMEKKMTRNPMIFPTLSETMTTSPIDLTNNNKQTSQHTHGLSIIFKATEITTIPPTTSETIQFLLVFQTSL